MNMARTRMALTISVVLYAMDSLNLKVTQTHVTQETNIVTAQNAVQEWMEVSMMNSFTQSAAKFFFDKYPQETSLFMLGHTEAITEEMCKEYIEWCRTDEGRSYLKGGANYKEDGGDD